MTFCRNLHVPLWLVLCLVTVSHIASVHGIGVGAVKAQQSAMDDDEQKVLAGAEEALKSQLGEIKKTTQDKESLAAAEDMLAVLAKPRVPITTSEELQGNWQVRSLQTGQYGAYTYPYFKCRIGTEGKDLVFHKSTGSQRRKGTLVREDENRYLFTGGAYVEGDPVGRYYGVKDNPTEAQKNNNSVGYLYKLGKGHYLMIFSPSGPNGEMYEMKK
ncbi:uncharacterized protein DUF4893 [Roseimicrobium gellanilyticum]|uniref:Uncharacterized protein DUF4893 n=1 Tax=Roseimicrobium gellanilyticum TaxID=748857 RepID=A0A366HGI7_9BACT|nr:DUF4893 domain-containing protein [Roseimicrobium gellanilyticum]RBP41321.1 uncharacterized protein DUF4893 [Roseimicrobium gellanilyticum]